MKQSIAYGIEKLGIPFIIVASKGQKMFFMIDTGSTDNLLLEYAHDYFTRFFDDVIVDSGQSVTSIGVGGVFEGKVCSFKFSIDKTDFEDEFVVLPYCDVFYMMLEQLGEMIGGILGGQFLRNNRIVIDYVSNYFYTKRARKVNKEG